MYKINCYSKKNKTNSLVKLAYIDLKTHINSTNINIFWENHNFISNNSLYKTASGGLIVDNSSINGTPLVPTL